MENCHHFKHGSLLLPQQKNIFADNLTSLTTRFCRLTLNKFSALLMDGFNCTSVEMINKVD